MSKSQGSGSQNQTGSTTPTEPAWLADLIKGVATGSGGAGGVPSIGSLYGAPPTLGISPTTYGNISQLEHLANKNGFNPTMTAAAGDLSAFAGSPGTPSAATKAALNEFNMLQAPGIENQYASMGLGNSGALGEGLAAGQATALTPLLEQDQANSLSAANALGSLGQQGYANKANAINTAFGASQLPAESAYNAQQSQFGLGTSTDQGILALLTNLFGTKSTSAGKSNTSSSGFDLSSFF